MNKILSFLKVIDYSWKESLSDMTMKNLFTMKYAMFMKNTLRFFIAFFVVFSVVPNTYFIGKTTSSFTIPIVLSYEDEQSGETKVGLVDVVLDYSQSEKFKQKQEKKAKQAEKKDYSPSSSFNGIIPIQAVSLFLPDSLATYVHCDLCDVLSGKSAPSNIYLRGPPQLTHA
jgi:hypothetical protein